MWEWLCAVRNIVCGALELVSGTFRGGKQWEWLNEAFQIQRNHCYPCESELLLLAFIFESFSQTFLLQITQWHNVIGSLQHLTVPLHWTFDRGLPIPMYFIRKIREVTPSALEKSSLKIVHFSFSRKMHFNSNIFKRNLNFQFGPENLRNAKMTNDRKMCMELKTF